MTEPSPLNGILRDLVLANRILAHENVIDAFGHVSVRHPDNPDRFLLSRSRSPALVTSDDIMEFERDGSVVAGDTRRPYAERYIHAAIYIARPDVHAVAHHHAPAVLPFSLIDTPLRPAFHLAAVIGPVVPVWDSQPEFGDTAMLVDSLEMGQSLAGTLADNAAALLRGHGAVCAAASLKAVCMTAIYMRDNAELILRTLPLGQPRYLSPGEIEKTATIHLRGMPLERAWDYWVARADLRDV